jgi:hypothetical protein
MVVIIDVKSGGGIAGILEFLIRKSVSELLRMARRMVLRSGFTHHLDV